MLEIYETNDADHFSKLRGEWNKVLENCKDNNIFLTWEVMKESILFTAPGRDLRILIIRDNGKIIAIAPLRRSQYRLGNLLKYQVIEPLTLWNQDYTGLILAERELECLSLFLDYLYQQSDWDFIYLYNIPETSIVHSLLTKVRAPIIFETRKGAFCPYLKIPDSMDTLMKNLSAKFRKNLRRSLRNLEKDCGRVELKKYTDIGPLEEAMKIFYDLHQKRWTSKGMVGNFDSQETRDSYLFAAKLFAENNWLALYFLTVNNKAVAVQYCLEYNHKIHYALGGYDPLYNSYGVGNILTMKVLEKCVEKKIKEYDFMRGDEAYKYNWNAENRRNIDTRFVNCKFSSRLLDLGIKKIKKTFLSSVVERYFRIG